MPPEHLPRLKAPREHGQFLVYPPLDVVPTLLSGNRALLGSPLRLLDRPLNELRAQARSEVLAATQHYLEQAREPVPSFFGDTWFVSGHQPEFFHPGVWVKNFLLQALAHKHRAVPLNLIVDDDTAKSTHLAVPAGNHVVRIAFDRWQSEVPFEERPVLDEKLFSTFPERVRDHARAWPFLPWLDKVWSALRIHSSATPLLGERIVRTRRQVEREFGLEPLELPLSAVCGTGAFAVFACALLADLPGLHQAYNGAVTDYRRRHGLRSKNHPVPDLTRNGERWETPFWAWRSGGQRRHRLFASPAIDGLALWSGEESIGRLVGSPTEWVEQWPSLVTRGFKVRTRALTTTLFCRLLLADVFVHGIGGGKYDEVTDALIRALFETEPPAFLVATATLLLPFERFGDARQSLRDLKHLERDLWYNPQRHLDDESTGTLLARKQAAQALPEQTHAQRVERFEALQRITSELRPFMKPRIEDLHARVLVAIDRLRRHVVASSRDYAFCLYPEEMLRSFFAEVQGTVQAS